MKSVRSSLAAPLAVAAFGAFSAAVVFVRDPRSTTYFACPFHAVTGLWCPGCGGIRALGDLVRGDVASAMGSNAVAVLFLVVGIAAWFAWTRARWRGVERRRIRPGRATVVMVVVAVAVFSVLRNTPWGTWLAPA